MAARTPEALYPSRAAAGALLGRLIQQRCLPPIILLGITPTGVEMAAHASRALGCSFDVIVGAHVRVQGQGVVGAVAEDTDAITDPDYNPTFEAMDALNEAMEQARHSIKTERLLFRGHRPLRVAEDSNVVVTDGQLTSPWKALAAAQAVQGMSPRSVTIAAAAATQAVQERIRARRYAFICPSLLMDLEGHPRPFGDPLDPSAERLRSIVVARQAA